MMYNVGDKIILREDLVREEVFEHGVHFVSEMEYLKSDLHKIDSIEGYYYEVHGFLVVDNMIDHDKVSQLKATERRITNSQPNTKDNFNQKDAQPGGDRMMYSVGDKIILREDLEHLEIVERGIYYTDKMDYMKKYFRKIERAGENSYKVDSFYVVDDMIDHERVEQLKALESLIDEAQISSELNSTPIKSVTYHRVSSQCETEEATMKYEVDDKVVLRSDLVSGNNYGDGSVVFTKEMECRADEVQTVKSLIEYEGLYSTEEGWLISDDMIDHEETALMQGGFIKIADEADTVESTTDIYESAYQSRLFSEYRAIMEFVAEKYIRSGGVDNLDKAIHVLRKLKEKEWERGGH